MTHPDSMTATPTAVPAELYDDCTQVQEGSTVEVLMDFSGVAYDVTGQVEVDSSNTAWIGGLIIGMMTRVGLSPSKMVRAIHVIAAPAT